MADKMSFDGAVYWKSGDEFPYCPKCKDDRDKNHRLVLQESASFGRLLKCPHCDFRIDEENIKKLKRPKTENLKEALYLLEKYVGALNEQTKTSAPHTLSASVNEPKSPDATKEQIAELELRAIAGKLDDVVIALDDCYAHLGFNSNFTGWRRKYDVS